MIEAVKLWNEPNNMSHWDFEVDAGWGIFSEMAGSPPACVDEFADFCARMTRRYAPS